MNITKVVISVLVVLIAWDIVTTYYGTVSIFSGSSSDVGSKLASVPAVVHIVAGIFSVGLITFILSYKHILRANNNITKGTLFVAFIYDFGTSIYGKWAIILLLAIMATSAPLLIHQVLEE